MLLKLQKYNTVANDVSIEKQRIINITNQNIFDNYVHSDIPLYQLYNENIFNNNPFIKILSDDYDFTPIINEKIMFNYIMNSKLSFYNSFYYVNELSNNNYFNQEIYYRYSHLFSVDISSNIYYNKPYTSDKISLFTDAIQNWINNIECLIPIKFTTNNLSFNCKLNITPMIEFTFSKDDNHIIIPNKILGMIKDIRKYYDKLIPLLTIKDDWVYYKDILIMCKHELDLQITNNIRDVINHYINSSNECYNCKQQLPLIENPMFIKRSIIVFIYDLQRTFKIDDASMFIIYYSSIEKLIKQILNLSPSNDDEDIDNDVDNNYKIVIAIFFAVLFKIKAEIVFQFLLEKNILHINVIDSPTFKSNFNELKNIIEKTSIYNEFIGYVKHSITYENITYYNPLYMYCALILKLNEYEQHINLIQTILESKQSILNYFVELKNWSKSYKYFDYSSLYNITYYLYSTSLKNLLLNNNLLNIKYSYYTFDTKPFTFVSEKVFKEIIKYLCPSTYTAHYYEKSICNYCKIHNNLSNIDDIYTEYKYSMYNNLINTKTTSVTTLIDKSSLNIEYLNKRIEKENITLEMLDNNIMSYINDNYQEILHSIYHFKFPTDLKEEDIYKYIYYALNQEIITNDDLIFMCYCLNNTNALYQKHYENEDVDMNDAIDVDDN